MHINPISLQAVQGYVERNQTKEQDDKSSVAMHRKFALLVGCVGVLMAGAAVMKTNPGNSFAHISDRASPYGSELSIYPASSAKTYAMDSYEATKPSDREIEKHILTENISSKWRVDSGFASRVVNSVYNEAVVHDLDPKLVLSVIAVESSFKKDSISRVGAEGLMQVWRKWHQEKFEGIGRKTSVEEDIGIGVKVLSEYMARENHNTTAALQRYNGTKKDSSHKYSKKVLDQFKNFKQALSDIDKDAIRERITEFVQVKNGHRMK